MDPGTLNSVAARKRALIERAAAQRVTVSGGMQEISRALVVVEGALTLAVFVKCVAAGFVAVRFMRSSKSRSAPPSWMHTAVTVLGITRRVADFVGMVRRRKSVRQP